jgi:hypothetical protein
MDPNNQNPQVDNAAVNKLEQDLKNLSAQTPVTPQTPIPVQQPVVPPLEVPKAPPVMPVAPVVPTVTPLETNIPVEEKPKKGSPIMIVAIILALVAVLAVVAYVFGAKLLSPKPSPTPLTTFMPTVTPTPSATPIVTTNWQVYTNTKNFYEFKYPSNYSVQQNGVTADHPETVDSIAVFNNTIGAKDIMNAPRFAITVSNISVGSLQKQASDHYSQLANYTIKDPKTASISAGFDLENNVPVVASTHTTFLGKDAYTYTIKGSTVDDKAAIYVTPLDVHKYIWFQNGNNVFLISLNDTNLMNQILSTFKLNTATSIASPTASPSSAPIVY